MRWGGSPAFILAAALLLASCSDRATDDQPSTITVYAAASLTDVVDELGALFTEQTGTQVSVNTGGSSMLARQIEFGAPADVFLSADREWMDYLEERDLLVPGSRRDVAGNVLVLIAPAGRGSVARIEPDFDPATLIGEAGMLAMGDPAHVPAGRYTQRALETLGWWEAVSLRVIPTHNVRAALRLVERGEAVAGVVYLTDAKTSERVEVLGRFPEFEDDPIRYPGAACRDAPAEAVAFLDFLAMPEAQGLLSRRGFNAHP